MRASVINRGITGAAAVAFGFGGAGVAQEVVELPRRDRPLSVETTGVYAVGGMAGEPWEQFADIRTVAFDDAGKLYVFDADNYRVVVVDGRGGHLREMGKEGEGPGELAMPMSMAVARDGTVAVFDMGHQGFVLFGADGAYRKNVPVDIQRGFPVRSLVPERGGGLLSASRGLVLSGPDEPEAARESGVPLLRYRLDGVEGESVPETLCHAWRPPPPRGPDAAVSAGGIELRAAGPAAFEPAIAVGALADGSIVLSDSTAWAVKILDPEGNLTRVLTRPFEPRAVTRRDERRERERRLEELASSGGPRLRMMTPDGNADIGRDQAKAMLERMIANLRFHPVIPVTARVAVDREDRIWVERVGRAVAEDGPVDVITAFGDYVGTIPPGGFRIPDAFGPGGLVAVIERDELDVPTVAVKRIRLGRE